MSILTFDSETIRALLAPYGEPTDNPADELPNAAIRSGYQDPAPVGPYVLFPHVSFADELEMDVEYYRLMDSDYGDFMIAILEAVRERIWFTGARTVAEYLDRTAALDAEVAG